MARKIIINGEDITTSKQISIKNRTIASIEIVDDAFLYFKSVSGDLVSQYFIKENNQSIGGKADVQLKDVQLGKHTMVVKYAVSDDRQEQSYVINVTVVSRDECFIKIDGAFAKTETVSGIKMTRIFGVTTKNITSQLNTEVSGNFATVRWTDEGDPNVNYRLAIDVQKNTTTQARNCTVKVFGLNSNGDTSYAYIYLVQQAGEEYTSIFEPSLLKYDLNGNEASILIDPVTVQNVNTDTVSVTSDVSWASGVYSERVTAIGDKPAITITVQANDSVNVRDGNLTVKATGTDGQSFNRTITLHQFGNSELPYISIDQGEDDDAFTIGNRKGDSCVVRFFSQNVFENSYSLIYDDYFNEYIDIDLNRDTRTIKITSKYANRQPEGITIDFVLQGQSTKPQYSDIVSAYFTVIIDPPAAYLSFPIWKTMNIEIPIVTPFYSIKKGDDLIFSGKVYAQKTDSVRSINVNDIIEDYTSDGIDITSSQRWQKTENEKVFTLANGVNETEMSDMFNLVVTDDWSYADRARTYFTSDPICYTLDSRQYFIFSVQNRYGDTLPSYSYQTDTMSVDGVETGDYKVVSDESYTQIIKDISNLKTIDITEINNVDDTRYFKVCTTKNKYCLYYKNLYGGYDSILLNPTSQLSASITDNTLTTDYDTTVLNHYKRSHSKTIQNKWTLKTNLLNDTQSEKMRHIYTSNQMWLHNLETGRLYAVNPVDKTFTEKTFKSNKHKPLSYTITVEEAYTQDRR